MDAIIEFLTQYGYWGMLVAAFLAGSFFPFSSEAVMAALALMGLDVWKLTIYSTIGNTLGGMFNYAVGSLGEEDWVYRIFHVKPDKLDKTRRLVQEHGAWMGLLSWIPILGSIITIAMGLLRVNFWRSSFYIFVGKCLRYVILSIILSFFQ